MPTNIKPDLVVAWPRAFDYPFFREFVVNNRTLFNQIIISFTDNDVSRDYSQQLSEIHKDWKFVHSKEKKDWFNDAITEALKHVKSDYILFMEQDFVCMRETLENVFSLEDVDVCYHVEGNRPHLSFFLVKTEMLNRTSKFFGIKPNSGLDNFGEFTKELLALPDIKTKLLLNVTKYPYVHLNGLTHNYRLAIEGKYDAVVRPVDFFVYNKGCLEATVEQIPEWLNIIKEIQEHENIDYV